MTSSNKAWRAPPPDWQMPSGLNRGLWDYIHSDTVADHYDEGLSGSLLFSQDIAFVDKHTPQLGTLLDLGCGTGRLVAAMAKKGHRVVGVDLSESMLAHARSKLEEASLHADLIKANITELECLSDGSFDYVACLFSTLGMIVGRSSRHRVIEQVHRLLRPGGRFYLHVHNRWFNMFDGPGRRWLFRDFFPWWRDGPDAGDRRMLPHQGVAGLTLHLFTRTEATRLLERAGFRLVEVLPVGLSSETGLRCPWWFGRLRAYGYLLAAER